MLKEKKENEDQIDWWSRFYETIKDEERLQSHSLTTKNLVKPKEVKFFEAENGINSFHLGLKKVVNPGIVRLKVLYIFLKL